MDQGDHYRRVSRELDSPPLAAVRLREDEGRPAKATEGKSEGVGTAVRPRSTRGPARRALDGGFQAQSRRAFEISYRVH